MSDMKLTEVARTTKKSGLMVFVNDNQTVRQIAAEEIIPEATASGNNGNYIPKKFVSSSKDLRDCTLIVGEADETGFIINTGDVIYYESTQESHGINVMQTDGELLEITTFDYTNEETFSGSFEVLENYRDINIMGRYVIGTGGDGLEDAEDISDTDYLIIGNETGAKKIDFPSAKQKINKETNEQISQLSEEMAVLKGDTIPEYWEEHLAERIARIKELQDNGGKNSFSFIVITDIHYEQNLGKISPLLAKKIAEDCGIKYVLILGDSGTRNGILYNLEYIENEWDNIESMISPIRNRLLMTDGNHDGFYGATDGDGDGVIDDVHGTGNSAFNFTPEKKYNRIKRKVSLMENITFDESGCGYYADDRNAKVRYIVLSTHNNKYEENEDGSSKYSNMINFRYGQSQFDMVINALNTLEDGYSVIVASHVPLDRSGELLHWGGKTMEDGYLTDGEVECWVMADVLNAFVNKTTYTGSFTGTQGARITYTNLVDKTSDDWLTGYKTSSSGVSAESGFDATNFLGDGVTPVGDMTIYYKNATVSNQRLVFYNANKEMVYTCYPTIFSDYTGFDGTATEGHLFIDKDKNEILYTTAVYVRLCLVSGDTSPIITLNEPIEASGESFDAVSVDVDFTNAKGTLVGYFGGHLHKDGVWGNTYTWNGRLKQCDFNTIATRCDSKNENDSTIEERVKETITEQSFDVFTVNKSTKTIYATKIGAGNDREIAY